MGIHSDDAVVLRRYLYRETSVIVTCLTERYGKIKGIVKGLRAQPNRHRSSMEPLTINRIIFYDTRTSQIHLISHCELLSPLETIQHNLEISRASGFCCELTDAIVPLEDPNAAIYQLLKRALECLASGAWTPKPLQAYFIVRLLRLSGFQPQLDECTGCGAHIDESGFWSSRQGGLLCRLCLHEDPKAESASLGMLNSLEQLANSEEPVMIEEKLLNELHPRLISFLHWRFDHPFKTLAT